MAAGMGAEFVFTARGVDQLSAPAGNAAKALTNAGKAADKTKKSMFNFQNLSTMLPGALGGAAGQIGMYAAMLGPVGAAVGAGVVAYREITQAIQASTQALNDSLSAWGAAETKLAEVQTILGITRGEMEKVQDTTRNMANEFGTTGVKQLEGFYQTASAGFPEAARAADVMSAANKLAVGGVADLFQTVDLLTTILNGYQISTDKAIDASDTLFQTVKYGKTTVAQLSGAFGKVVPGSAAAGVSLEEAASAMATLTLAGQSTDEAATALARAFDFLIKKPKEAMKVMEEYGVSAEDLDVSGRGLLPVLQSIGKAFEGNEEALVTAVPQIRAFRAILPLATTMSEKFGMILGDMNNKAGATDKAFGAVANTLEFQKRRWESFMGGVKSKVGEVFAPAITKALDVATDFLSIIDKLPDGMKDLIFGAVGVGLALPTLVGKIGSLLWTMGKLALVFSLVYTTAQSLAVFFPAIGAAMGPVIARVIRFAVAWKTNFAGIQDRMQAFHENFKLVMQGLGEALTSSGRINDRLGKDLEKRGLLPYVGKLYALLQRVQTFIESFWKGFAAAALAGADSLDDVSPTLKLIVDLFKSMGEESDLQKKIPIEEWAKAGKDLGESLGGIVQALSDMRSAWTENEGNITIVVNMLKTLWVVTVAIAKVFMAVVDAIKWIIDKWDYISLGLMLLNPGMAPVLGGEQLTRAESPISKALMAAQKFGGLGPAMAAPYQGPAGGPVTEGGPKVGQASRGRGKPVQVHMTSNLVVDGEKLAKVVQQQQVATGEETFDPFGMPESFAY